jgi:hypothetical protein
VDAPGRSFDHEFEIVVEPVPTGRRGPDRRQWLKAAVSPFPGACAAAAAASSAPTAATISAFCGTDLDAADAEHEANVTEMRQAAQGLRDALAERG